MADADPIINRSNIITFASGALYTASDLNTTITEIIDFIDASVETSTGHDHDGINSKKTARGYSPAEILRGV